MKLENITIQLEEKMIIKPLNMVIPKGGIFVLMGPSGSGKTTLLKGLCGLTSLTSGQVKWEDGEGQLGLVFQENRLFPHMTVEENLAFGLRARGMKKKDRLEKVNKYIKIFELEGLEKRFPHQLSGGQKQRVSLGRALVLEPDVLLLDEPFASLDTPLRQKLTDWLYDLQRKEGFSILWVTHYIDEAFAVADQIGILMDGELLQIGSPLEVYQRPTSKRVAEFFQLPNCFNKEDWKKWLPEIKPQNEMGWVPPDALAITSNQVPFQLVGTVYKIKNESNGFSILLKIEQRTLRIFINQWDSCPSIGDKVVVTLDPHKIFWFPR